MCIALLLTLLLNANGKSFTVNDTRTTDNFFAIYEIEKGTNIQDTLSVKKSRLITVVSGFSVVYLSSMAYLQYVWYKDHERISFHYYNDLVGYNQIDKLGHLSL
jgi:hypothetical protein